MDRHELKKQIAELNQERSKEKSIYEEKSAKIGKEIAARIKEVYGERENFPEYEFLELVHKLICIDKMELEDALSLALEERGKDSEWYDDIKYVKTGDMSSRVIDKYKNKQGYKELVRDGNMSTSVLRKSPHTQAHIRYIGSARRLVNRIVDVEKRMKELEAKVDNTLNASDRLAVKLAYFIHNDIDPKTTDKKIKQDVAKLMYMSNMDITEITDFLGISKRTAWRYLQLS